jgi:hypothetical protein
MTRHDYWTLGDQVVLREVWRGRVWSAKPVTVVRDDGEITALYIASGTRWKQPQALDGQRVGVDEIIRGTWKITDVIWTGGGALFLHPPGAGYALLGFWDECHRVLLGWYLNLQEPMRRTPVGFDYFDLILDVEVSPDRSFWEWKDEDDFAEAQSRGLFAPEQAKAIRAEGEHALKLLLVGEPPYDPGWERWVPDPTWSVPHLPVGWNKIPR